MKYWLIRLSRFLRVLGNLGKASLGIKDNMDGMEDYRSLYLTAWIFLLGLPISILIFGEAFPALWLLIVAGFLILSNLEYTIKAYSVLQD